MKINCHFADLYSHFADPARLPPAREPWRRGAGFPANANARAAASSAATLACATAVSVGNGSDPNKHTGEEMRKMRISIQSSTTGPEKKLNRFHRHETKTKRSKIEDNNNHSARTETGDTGHSHASLERVGHCHM
jgi:hypothetical protein